MKAAAILIASFLSSGLLLADLAQAATIQGEIVETTGLRLLTAREVELTFVGSGGRVFKVTSGVDGHYSIVLPADTYRTHLRWSDSCSERRAAFRLKTDDHLTMDFMTVRCGVVDSESNVPPRVAGDEPLRTLSHTPIAKQVSRFQEQLFSAHGRVPEIVIAFGKFDRHGEETTYFPFQPRVVNRSSQPLEFLPFPVTLTVQNYTVHASSIVLNNKTMTFEARGQVTISDGNRITTAKAALVRFRDGQAQVSIEQ